MLLSSLLLIDAWVTSKCRHQEWSLCDAAASGSLCARCCRRRAWGGIAGCGVFPGVGHRWWFHTLTLQVSPPPVSGAQASRGEHVAQAGHAGSASHASVAAETSVCVSLQTVQSDSSSRDFGVFPLGRACRKSLAVSCCADLSVLTSWQALCSGWEVFLSQISFFPAPFVERKSLILTESALLYF